MEIKQVNNKRIINYMARDYESLLNSMRQLAPELLPEWTEYEKESDFGNVLLQLFAHMGDILSYYQDRVVNESFLSSAVERKSVIDHLRLIGYRMAPATPAATELTIQIPSDCEEVIVINTGDAFSTVSNRDASSVRFEYTGEVLTINCAELSAVDDFIEVPLQVEEGRLIREDVLGTSTGEANQRFPLVYRKLILRSIGDISDQSRADVQVWYELDEITDGEWRLQDSLAFSREGAQDFTVEIDENEQAFIVFGGDGFGAIPPLGAVIKARYRVGGGVKGNVVAETITSITEAPALTAVGASVINRDPASGGAERETNEHAIKYAPGVFRSLNRAVTADDYKNLALNYPGVAKVIAEPTSWNRVTLFVAPEGGGQVSDSLRQNLLAYFEDKRPISTIIEVEDVDYLKIYLSAEIGVEGYFAESDIYSKVERAVADLLSFDNNDFKTTLYLSKFYEAIEAIEGVKYVLINEFMRQRRPGENEESYQEEIDKGRLELQANELPRIPGTLAKDPNSDQAYKNGILINAELSLDIGEG